MTTLRTLIEQSDDSEMLDDLVHDVASRIASRVNNEGIKEQIAFLNEFGLSDEDIKSQLIEDGLLPEDSDPLTQSQTSFPELK